MLPITPDLLTNRTNRPALRNATEYALRQLKGIVAHWTANTKKGANAKANRNYFNGVAAYASAHYVVDDHSILQCIPDNEVGYHVGAKQYKPDGQAVIGNSGLSPNYFLIGFEMCVNQDGDWEKTYKNSVSLASHLLVKYRFTTDQLYRHFDITGKDCPKMMLTDTAWKKFKADVTKAMAALPGHPLKLGTVKTDDLNIRKGPGTQFAAIGKLQKGQSVEIFDESNGWLEIGANAWVSKNFITITLTVQKGVVNDPTGANVRAQPVSGAPIVDALPKGALVDILEEKDKWYRIGSQKWVFSSLISTVKQPTGKVIGTDSLNVRKGPGTTFPIVKKLAKNTTVELYETEGKWVRIAEDAWVFSDFIERD